MRVPMTSGSETDLETLLRELSDRAASEQSFTVGELLQSLGRRSFAPVLLIAAAIGFTPFGAVPGMPTILAIVIILVTAQIILGRRHLWLPEFIRKKSLSRRRVLGAVKYLRKPARFLDRIVRPRLTFLTEKPFSIFLATACLVLALAVPPLELVPLVDMPLWAAILALSFALASHDGLVAIIAFAITIVSLWVLFASFY
jgi:hypothetical protein